MAVLAAAAAVVYTLGRSPFLGQWDSFDYAKQIVTHSLSDLGFGRPVFIGLNIVVWETAKRIFGLGPLAVEPFAMTVAVVSGVAGVLLFRRLARNMLPPHVARLAVAAFLLSPVYAVYSGYVMSDVPMLSIALASAVILWEGGADPRPWRLIAAGMLFGASCGVREQALFLAPALAWIVLARIPGTAGRVRALLLFGAASAGSALAPVAWLYLQDPARFAYRTRVWLGAIPMGETHFWRNVEATALYTILLAPAAWLAALGALAPRRPVRAGAREGDPVPLPVLGVVLCLLLPVAALWRNADVQIHPRYVLPALPAAAVLCAAAFARRYTSARAAVVWGLLQVLFFAAAQGVLRPLRSMQREKREYARQVVEHVPGEALLIAGAYSPVLDFYRATGVRPGWRILWSGWGWNPGEAGSAIRKATASGLPVLLCDGPWAWLYFEDQRLDLHFLLDGRKLTAVAPGLSRLGERTRPPDQSPASPGSSPR